jgi:serine/threonine protein kinase
MLSDSPQTPHSTSTWDGSPCPHSLEVDTFQSSPLLRKILVEDLNPSETPVDNHAIESLFSEEDIELTKQILGKGSFCRVVKAVSSKTGKSYAVKMPVPQQGSYISLLQHEITILARLGLHQNIIRCYGLLSNRSGLVLELQDQSMASFVAHAARPDNENIPLVGRETWLQWALQLCEALQFLKSKSVVHCDLKTDNILLSKSNQHSRIPIPILADFSSAHTTDELEESDSVHLSTTAFSFEFSAPELLADPDLAPNFSTDLYSLGLIMLHVATGNEPYHRAIKSFPQKLIWAKQGAALKVCSAEDVRRLSSIMPIMESFLSTRIGIAELIREIEQGLHI